MTEVVDRSVRRALGHGSLYGGVTFVRMLSGFLLLPVLTRALPVEQYAVVALIAPLVWLLQSVVSLGLNEGLARVTADLPKGSPHSVAAAYRSCAVVGALGLVVGLTGPLWSQPLVGIPWGSAVAAGVVAGTLMSMVAVITAVLRGEERAASTASLTTAAALASPILGLVLVFMWERTATAYLVGTAIALAAVVGPGLLLVRRGRIAGVPGDGVTGNQLVRSGLRVGLPTVPHLVALLALEAGLRRVVAATSGLAAVAGFSVAVVLGSLVWTMLKAFSAAWAPIVYRAEDEHVEALMLRLTRALLTLALLGQVALDWAAPLLSKLFLPASYADQPVVAVVLIVSLCSVPATVFSAQIVALLHARRSHTLAFLTPTAVLLSVAAAIPAAHWFGEQGVAGAYAGCFLLCAAGSRWLGSGRQVAPGVLVLAGALSLAVASLAGTAAGQGWPWAARGCVAFACAAVCAVTLGRGVVGGKGVLVNGVAAGDR